MARTHVRSIGVFSAAWALLLIMWPIAGRSGAALSQSQSGKPPLVIGISMSLSGDFADLAKPAVQGYQLWADTVNAHGGLLGRKVELKIVDDASNPTQAVSNYENLISADHVDLVFGPFSSLLTVPAATVANRYGYALIEGSGTAPAVFNLHLHNVFATQPGTIVNSAQAFSSYILSLPKSQRPKTAAYPTADDPTTVAVVSSIQHRLEHAGIRTVYATTYAAETLDQSPIVTKLVSAKPDLVVSGTAGADAVAQTKGLIAAHWTPKFLFFTNDDTTYGPQVGLSNAEGVLSTGDWVAAAKTAGNAQFVKNYVAKYGGAAAQIDPSAAEAYACGQLLQLVVAHKHKIDNATIISALHHGTWPTVEGDLSWNADGAPLGNDLVLQWVHGELTPVYPPSAAFTHPISKPAWSS